MSKSKSKTIKKLEKAEEANPDLLKDNPPIETPLDTQTRVKPTKDLKDPAQNPRANLSEQTKQRINKNLKQYKNKKTQTFEYSKDNLPEHIIDFVSMALTDGYTEGRIIELVSHFYGVTNRKTISDHIFSAKEKWSKQDNSDKNYLLSKYETMYMSIYREARINGSYNTCVQILDNLSKLHKLYSEQDATPLKPNITYIKINPEDKK